MKATSWNPIFAIPSAGVVYSPSSELNWTSNGTLRAREIKWKWTHKNNVEFFNNSQQTVAPVMPLFIPQNSLLAGVTAMLLRVKAPGMSKQSKPPPVPRNLMDVRTP